jgi:hypothetical protein
MSCLFISLGKLLNIAPSILRNQICDYIITNPSREWDGTKLSDWIQMVAGDRFQTIDQYIAEMRYHSQWGGAPEIAVCCMIYNVSIEIINQRDLTPQTSPATSNLMFRDHSAGSLPVSKARQTWKEFEEKLHHQYPGLTKMLYFRDAHPLKKNYDSFMEHKKQEFLEKRRIEISRDISIQAGKMESARISTPILIISWTGNHYEPVEIKNRHPS